MDTETQLVSLLRLFKEILQQLKNGQRELRDILRSQTFNNQNMHDYAQKLPEILDGVVEKNNTATQKLLDALDEKYNFLVNTESEQYKGLSIMQAWFFKFGLTITDAGNPWAVEEVATYLKSRISVVEQKVGKPTIEMSYEERARYYVDDLLHIKEEIDLDDLGFFTYLTSYIVHLSATMGKKHVEFPRMDLWNFYYNKIRTQLLSDNE